MKRFLTIIFLILAVGTVKAQDNKLTVDAEFLSRGELRIGGLAADGDDIPDNASFILERTRLGIEYRNKGLSAKITAQHSGTWGSSQAGNFIIYEAWTKLGSQNGFFAQVGRQNLSYDDQRIFGSDNWSMTGLSHDALKLGYEGHGHKVHLIGAYNQDIVNMYGGSFFSGGIQPYKSMEAFWYHYDVPGTKLGASLLFVNIGMQGGTKGIDEQDFFQQMTGGYISYSPKKWSAEAAYYYQMGKEEHGLPIDAWMTSAKFTVTPGRQWVIYGGYDYLSGDEHFATPMNGALGLTRHETIHGFSSIYGSRHRFYGAMDFFYVSTYVAGFTPGLQNLYLGGRWNPGDKLSLDASFHFLATATKLNNADKPLGHEMEFAASYKLLKDCNLSIGYSFMDGTDTMVILKKAADKGILHWGWVMLIVHPRFFDGNR